MKTAKYSIEFDHLETLSTSEIFITKEEFYKQLSRYRKQVEETKGCAESPVEERETDVYDLPQLVKTVYIFRCGCSSLYLTEYKCKPGYGFKNKK